MDDWFDDPARAQSAASPDNAHLQRNHEHAEVLNKSFERWRHAAHIREALRRTGREREADESNRWGGY